MKKYECTLCGYVYDPEVGDPDGGIAAGTAFEDIPEDWGHIVRRRRLIRYRLSCILLSKGLGRGFLRGVHRVSDRASHEPAYRASYPGHGPEADSQIGKLAYRLVFRHVLRDIKAAFLSVCIAFLRPLGRLGL